VRKSATSLDAPPLSPPTEAEGGAEGLRYQILKRGVGEPIGQNDAIQAELSIWSQDGTLGFSSYKKGGPIGLNGGSIPAPLFDVLSPLPAGSKVWLWLPAALVHSLKQQRPQLPFPDAAIVIEYEPVQVTHRPLPEAPEVAATEAVSKMVASRFPKPDAAGPPKSALTTPNGYRYVMLAAGSGGNKPKPDERLALELTLWPVLGLVVEPPLLNQRASATTLQRAPAGLGQVLATMTPGGVARVWLSAGKAQQVAPVPAGREAVLDVALERIE
jgi:hypothetical protein